MKNVLIGKRVILFNLEPADLDHFVKLHREDKNGYLHKYCFKEMTDEEARKYLIALLATQQILVFTAYTKEGKASRRAGYVYLSDVSQHACSLTGIMDKEFSTGLAKQLRKGKNTFSQDALHVILGYCFLKLGIERVQTDVVETNRLAMALLQREGFTKEGTLRKYICINGNDYNVAIWSILKEEYHDGQEKRAEYRDTDISKADTADIPNAVGNNII